MSFYRERFGHREGEFPVCEDVSRRSLALPFFPELTEGAGRACHGHADGHNQVIRTRAEKQRLERRNAQLVGAVGFLLAAAMPVVLWHRPMAMVIEDFRFESSTS